MLPWRGVGPFLALWLTEAGDSAAGWLSEVSSEFAAPRLPGVPYLVLYLLLGVLEPLVLRVFVKSDIWCTPDRYLLRMLHRCR